MIIFLRHFIRFIDGRAGDRIVIAFLPGSLGGHIGTLQTNVSIRRDYAKKLLRRGIDSTKFEHIQATIDNGYCLVPKPLHLSFLYYRGEMHPEIYFLLLKTDRTLKELWLVTFHRIKPKQYNRRLSQGTLIREHSEEFME